MSSRAGKVSEAMPLSPLHPPPLVGRERELVALRERLAGVLAGYGSLALIGGEAGIGKTALAETLCREAEEQGALVLVGRCFDLTETPPYGPWVDLFARYGPNETLPPPPIFAHRGVIGGVSSPAATLEQCASFFRALAATRPIVLLLDDLHWADPASLDLLRVLAREAHTMPLLIVATYRPDETPSQSPLSALLPALVREAQPARLALSPLSADAIRTLVTARYALPGADAERLTRYLAQRSEGNAFFLGELIRTLEEQGGLVATAAGWRIADIRAARVPALVRQVIGNRLARFGEAERGALAVAAVIGQEVPIDLWQQVVEMEEHDLLPLIEHAVAARVVVASEDGESVRFYHALTREALYDGILPPRRRAWHRTIGEILAARPAPQPDAVAHHFERAGDARAAGWLIRAGEQAQAAYAYLTAAERYEAAMRFMEAGEATSVPRGWLILRLAWLRFYQEPDQSARRADEVVRLVADAEDRELAACALFSRGHFRVTSGDFRAGLRDIRAGVAALDALPDGEATWRTALRVLNLPLLEPFHPRGVLTATLAYCGHFAEAREVGERAIALARSPRDAHTGYHVSEMQAHLGLGIAYAGLGEPEQSRRAFAAARATLRASPEYSLPGLVDLYEFTFPVLMFQADDVAERRRLVAAAQAGLSEAPGTIADDHFVLFAGLPLSFCEGRWDEMRALAEQGPLAPPSRLFQYAALGALANASGDIATAWRRVREVLPAGPATEPGDGAITTLLAYQRLAAALALDAHDLPTARAWLDAHDRFLQWSGSVPGRAEGQIGWAAFYRATGNLPRAVSHATEARTLAEQPRQPLALLAARRTLGELAIEAGRFDNAEGHLDAALALADACAAPYERALTLLAQAELRLACTQPPQAPAALDEARAIFTTLGAAPALARADAMATRLAVDAAPGPAPPASLTAREVEVLRLIAAGQTTREIADALGVSVHTARSHVMHIFDKTGCENRAAAAVFALRHRLA